MSDPTQSSHVCPYCGNTTAIISQDGVDYITDKKERKTTPPLLIARCFYCKWHSESFTSRAKLILQLTYALPGRFIMSGGAITSYYQYGSESKMCSLTSVVIPPTINGVAPTQIGINAFSNIDGAKVTGKGVTSVYMPSSIVTISNNAFRSNAITTIGIGADVAINASSTTMGTNGDFKTDYEAADSTAGTYNYTEGTWVLEE